MYWIARGYLYGAIVCLTKSCNAPDTAMTVALQDFVKQTIAPYKYPRAIEYMAALPRTEVGKLQRYKLRSATNLTP